MTFDAWWATLELAEQRRVEKAYAIEAFKAGAASRDDEVATLHRSIDFDQIQAQQETIDQLREQVTTMRQIIRGYCKDHGINVEHHRLIKLLVATEPK